MLLYHSTSLEHARSILATGFRGSTVKDSFCHVWFCADPAEAVRGARAVGCLVIIDLPDSEAAAYRCHLEDGSFYLCNYSVPCGIVNSRRPFRFEPPLSDS